MREKNKKNFAPLELAWWVVVASVQTAAVSWSGPATAEREVDSAQENMRIAYFCFCQAISPSTTSGRIAKAVRGPSMDRPRIDGEAVRPRDDRRTSRKRAEHAPRSARDHSVASVSTELESESGESSQTPT
jgi:hypothetical protein